MNAEPATESLLNVKELSRMLGVSVRHCFRMNDRADLPRPVRLGAAVRWRRSEIEAWIAGGCKPMRNTRGAA